MKQQKLKNHSDLLLEEEKFKEIIKPLIFLNLDKNQKTIITEMVFRLLKYQSQIESDNFQLQNALQIANLRFKVAKIIAEQRPVDVNDLNIIENDFKAF